MGIALKLFSAEIYTLFYTINQIDLFIYFFYLIAIQSEREEKTN